MDGDRERRFIATCRPSEPVLPRLKRRYPSDTRRCREPAAMRSSYFSPAPPRRMRPTPDLPRSLAAHCASTRDVYLCC